MTAARRRLLAGLVALSVFGFAVRISVYGRGGTIDSEAERATGLESARPPAPLGAPELAASGANSAGTNAIDVESSARPKTPWKPPDLAISVEFVDSETGARVRGCDLAAPEGEIGLTYTTVPGWIKLRILERGMEDAYGLGMVHRAIVVPDGYVVVARTSQDSKIAFRSTAFRIVQPVHREQAVRVTFLGAAGTPTSGGRVVAWRVGDVFNGTPVVEQTAAGAVRLRGVPFIPGALLRIRCERDPVALAGVEAVPELGEAELSNFESPLRWPIPPSPEEWIDARVLLAALADPTIRDHNVSDNDLPTEDSLAGGPDLGVGSVRVEARGRDGKPIESVAVSIERRIRTTKEDGVAIFDSVAAGHRRVTVRELGRLFEGVTIFVTANAETRVTMNEIEGGTIQLEVVDADGKPSPFARIGLRLAEWPPWIDIDDAGEQRLDPFTDVRGRRTCARIAPGMVTVTARHGDGHAKAEVELHNGERRALRLELR